MKVCLVSVYREPEAAKILYALLEQRVQSPEMNISHAAMPSWRAHLRFIRSRPYQVWFIVKAEDLPAGTIYGTRLNEIGMHLFPDHQHQGIGREALAMFLRRARPLPAVPAMRSGKWMANVNPANIRSAKFFSEAGFRLKQLTFQL